MLRNSDTLSLLQAIALVALRILIGWQILFEGLSKLLTPGWSSYGYLNESQWIFSGLAKWIVANNGVLNFVNILNIWGLIAIGLGLVLGLFSRYAAISGAILLFVYFLVNPPLIGLEYSVPSEGNYLIVNKTLIESVALVVTAVFHKYDDYGLESLFKYFIKKR